MKLLGVSGKKKLLHCQGNDQTASGEDGSRCISSNVAASATANHPRTHRDTTAKATTRLRLEKMGPDASASNVAASATANHPRNKLQHHANASKSAACATVNHHQNTPQNQTKTQRHTTHENCLTSLSEALKEEAITLPRQRPDCIWRRWVQMHLIQCSRFRNGEPPSNAPRHHRQGNDQTASGEDGSRCICIQCSRFRNGEPPSEQAPTPRKRIQSSRLRNSKPPSEHAPKPDKNAAPHHPRKLPNVAF